MATGVTPPACAMKQATRASARLLPLDHPPTVQLAALALTLPLGTGALLLVLATRKELMMTRAAMMGGCQRPVTVVHFLSTLLVLPVPGASLAIGVLLHPCAMTQTTKASAC